MKRKTNLPANRGRARTTFLGSTAPAVLKTEVSEIFEGLAAVLSPLDSAMLATSHPALLARIMAVTPVGLDLVRILRDEVPACVTHTRDNVAASLRAMRTKLGRAPGAADYPAVHVVPVLAWAFYGGIEAWGAWAHLRRQHRKGHWASRARQRTAVLDVASRFPDQPITHALLTRAGYGRLASILTAADLATLATEIGVDRRLRIHQAHHWTAELCMDRYADLCRTTGITLSSHALTLKGGEGCTIRAKGAAHFGRFRAFQAAALARHPDLHTPQQRLARDGTRMDSWNEVKLYNAIRGAFPAVRVAVHVRLPGETGCSCDIVLDDRVYVEMLGVAVADMPKARNKFEGVYAARWAAKAALYAAHGIVPVLVEPLDIVDPQRLAARLGEIAGRLGLPGPSLPPTPGRTVRAHGTWSFSYLCDRVAEAATEMGGWPTHADLIARDCTAATVMLKRPGVAVTVSARIGVPLRHRRGVWTAEGVTEAITAWAAEHGRYPTAPDRAGSGQRPLAAARVLLFRDRQDLLHAEVERRCGQRLPRRQVPSGSYDTVGKLTVLLRPLCVRLGRLPTGAEMREAGLPDSVFDRVSRDHGMRAMAAHMGVPYAGPRVLTRAQAVQEFAARLPQVPDLLGAGRMCRVVTTPAILAAMGAAGISVMQRQFGNIAGLRRALAQHDAAAGAEDGAVPG